MSHYATIETRFKYKKELIEALQSIYGKDAVEVHDHPVNLVGYEKDERPQKANIIVRRSHLSRASNDLGFVFLDGVYKTIIGDYDAGTGAYSGRTPIVNMKMIVSRYAENVIKSRLPRKYQMVSNDGNEIVLKQLY